MAIEGRKKRLENRVCKSRVKSRKKCQGVRIRQKLQTRMLKSIKVVIVPASNILGRFRRSYVRRKMTRTANVDVRKAEYQEVSPKIIDSRSCGASINDSKQGMRGLSCSGVTALHRVCETLARLSCELYLHCRERISQYTGLGNS